MVWFMTEVDRGERERLRSVLSLNDGTERVRQETNSEIHIYIKKMTLNVSLRYIRICLYLPILLLEQLFTNRMF